MAGAYPADSHPERSTVKPTHPDADHRQPGQKLTGYCLLTQRSHRSSFAVGLPYTDTREAEACFGSAESPAHDKKGLLLATHLDSVVQACLIRRRRQHACASKRPRCAQLLAVFGHVCSPAAGPSCRPCCRNVVHRYRRTAASVLRSSHKSVQRTELGIEHATVSSFRT